MPNDIKRMNYYNGLFLKEDDFQLEQNYHMRLHRLHNRYLHNVWGVADGLEVKALSGTKKFTVSKGVAITQIKTPGGESHAVEVVLPEDRDIDLSEAGYPAGSKVYITISYAEALADIDRDKGENKIHVIEEPKIEAKTSAPSDPKSRIVLAGITIPSGANWKSQNAAIDLKGRKSVQIITGDHDHDGKDSNRISAIDKEHFNSLSGANLTDLNPNRIKGIIPASKLPSSLVGGSAVNAKFHPATGHDHNGVDSKKLPGINSKHFTNLSGANLTDLNPNKIKGTIPASKIDKTIARDSEINTLLPLIRKKHVLKSQTVTNKKIYRNIPGLTLTFTTNRPAMLLCIFNASPAGNSLKATRTYWQLLLDNKAIAYSMKHSQANWELGSVMMLGVEYVKKGKHTVKVQWKVGSGMGYCPHINTSHGDVGMRGLTVVEFPTVFNMAVFNTLHSVSSAINFSHFIISNPQ